MMRSLYSGISGLKVHQIQMDVIGNNIANVNTIAYKSSRVTFQEILNQTLKNASAPSQIGDRGGTNPQQIGLGVSLATIDVLHTRTGVQRTDKATDLAIDGEGYFVVTDGINEYYTRAGSFDIDVEGNLVYPGGFKVLGWSELTRDPQTGIEHVNTTGIPRPINLSGLSMTAKATDIIRFEGNLDGNSSIGDEITYSSSVFDSQGNEHKIDFVFTKQAPNVWSWKMIPAPVSSARTWQVEHTSGGLPMGSSTTIDTGKPIVYAHEIKNISVQTAAGLTRYEYTVVSSQAEFDEKINNLGPGHAVVLIDGNEHVRVAFGDDLAADDVVLIDFNEYPISHIEPMVGIDPSLPGAAQGYDLDGDGNDDIPAGTAHGVLIFSEDGKLLKSLINTGISIVMNANESGANNIFLSGDSFQFSSEKFTQYADATVIRGAASGYRSGSLNSISIDQEGRIIGYYSNGQSREDAVLAIALFRNPGGLNKIGNNLFQNTVNAGLDDNYARAGIGGRGVIISGALEMSNVDLAKEFTDMIVAQRGFQANSRIITVADEMLQELVNIKR